MKFGFNHIGLAGTGLAMLLISCGKQESSKPDRVAVGPRSVRVATVETRPMPRVLHVSGTLSARDEATVSAQVAGQIERSLVDLGDRVSAGQELALIDTTAYQALIGQASANLARAKASAANAAQNLKRAQDLQKEKIASASDLDLAVAEAGRTQAEVKAAEAAEVFARINVERSHLRAPFDGVIAQRLVTAGDYAAVGQPLFRLVKVSPLRLRLDVPERESISVRADQEVRLHVEGDTNTYTGRLTRIAPSIRQADRTLQVEADVPQTGTLRAGIFTRAQIIVSEDDPGLAIPARALTSFAGLDKVVVFQDGKAVEKTVTTGRRGADWIEVVSGLNSGEVVVLDPAGIRTGAALTLDAKAR